MGTRMFRAVRGTLTILLPALLLVALCLPVLSGCEEAIVQQVTSTAGQAATSTSSSSTSSSETTTSTEPAFTQKAGEIFLEAAGEAGPESFTGEEFLPAGPPTTLSIPTSTTQLPPPPSTTPGAQTQVVSYQGDTPALYGGSKSKALADKEGQLRFFERNPDKAAAFCAALNSDPTFKWSGGTQVQPAQLRDYFEELTPVMLTRDTRVTNYGYRNGKPTPRQSVLQAGQMVLVDRYGVPRVRCECGNPLTPPQAVPTTPTYTGPRWPDFDPTVIIVIQETTVVIEEFILIDIYTGDRFRRPPGTEGAKDEDYWANMWQIDVEMFWDDTQDQHQFTVNWTGAFSLNPDDGMLSGEGAGQWHVEGAYFEGSEVAGQMTGDGSFLVYLTGEVAVTDTGRMLTVRPEMAEFSIDDQTWDGTDAQTAVAEEAQADFEGSIEGLIVMSFTELQLPATDEGPVYADLMADPFAGSATLKPYEP